jgi:hypothetical protein
VKVLLEQKKLLEAQLQVREEGERGRRGGEHRRRGDEGGGGGHYVYTVVGAVVVACGCSAVAAVGRCGVGVLSRVLSRVL